ncbi:MAG: hypothetical protein Ct9H300mP15_03680 [Gemmatimonadota bacterium]|nr:MAG: hypothetical protein Ct9H300mP15_03680 [Gemmatimonadota bacterium]
MKADLAAYLEMSGGPKWYGYLADIIAFNESNADREMPYFGQETFLEAEEKGSLDSSEYLESKELARRLSQDEGIDAVMEEHQLDAIIAPTTRPAWKIDLVNRDVSSNGSSGQPQLQGIPALQCLTDTSTVCRPESSSLEGPGVKGP